MKVLHILGAFSLSWQTCFSAAVGFAEGRLEPRDSVYQPIEPEEIIARLGTNYQDSQDGSRREGMVYLCREENWGPPCYVYSPPQHYYCQVLNDDLYQHVGSVFVESNTICRFAVRDTPGAPDQCDSISFFAWPETENGWPDLFHREVPGSDDGSMLGYYSTYFMCAECTNCN